MRILAHGDHVLADDINALRVALDDANARIGATSCHLLAPSANGSGNVFFFIHRYRWLHFRSTGAIISTDGANSAGLTEKNGTFTSFDLDSLDWLSYGQLYQVTGCEMACEDWES